MKYLYKTFKNPGDRYFLYETVSNQIFTIPRPVFDKINRYFNTAPHREHSYKHLFTNNLFDNLRKRRFIHHCLQSGLIRENRLTEVELFFCESEIRDELPQSLRKLVLGVTNKCNLRCDYCAYSGHYTYLRSHGYSSMSEDTVWKALELYNTTDDGIRDIDVSFYGGEPLLEIELIQKAISFQKKIFPHRRHVYHISTNGLKINQATADWFSSDDTVFLNISIDGHQKSHDRHRKFPDGRGTFAKLEKNLYILFNTDPKAYIKRVSFNCTLTGSTKSVGELYDFFRLHELFKNNKVSASCIEYDQTDGLVPILEGNPFLSQQEEDYFLRLFIDNQNDSFAQSIFSKAFHRIKERDHCILENKITMDAQCFPFSTGIFIDVNGNINLCHNMEGSMGIGNLENGVDWTSLRKLIIDFKEVLKPCLKCWANRLCNICVRHMFSENGYDEGRHKKACENMRTNAELALKWYCHIKQLSNE